jgi:hypothetical protein
VREKDGLVEDRLDRVVLDGGVGHVLPKLGTWKLRAVE